MALLKQLSISESVVDLKKLQKQQPGYLAIRIQMLLVMKSQDLHSKRGLSEALGVSANTVQQWKTLYDTGGLSALLSYDRGGHKKPIITGQVEKKILAKLSNPHDAPSSFKELQQWVDENLIKGINYHTLNKHVKRKFKAKLKVARKSHVAKDEQAVSAFKKNR
jgi:transposase